MGGEWRDKPRSPMDTGGGSGKGSRKLTMFAFILTTGSFGFVLTPALWIILHR